MSAETLHADHCHTIPLIPLFPPTAQWVVGGLAAPQERAGLSETPYQWAPSLTIPHRKSHVPLGSLVLPSLTCMLVPEALSIPSNLAIKI